MLNLSSLFKHGPYPYFALIAVVFICALLTYAWEPVAIADDPLVIMPGSQPGDVLSLQKNSSCTKCHGDYDPAAEPEHGMTGSMMAQATRDPLWLACVAVAEQDSVWAVGTPNAGDLCIRCHTPSGWLAGRSDPPNMTSLDAGQGDFEGLSCSFCHRMVDPMVSLGQPDVPPEPVGSAQENAAEVTAAVDRSVLQNITLFDGSDFFDPGTDLPVHYEAGDLTKYIEAAGGQFFVDPQDRRRGPRHDVDPTHQFFYSRFLRSKSMCGTCHDVSNPVLANLSTDPGFGPDASEKRSAASYFHVERTFSEFQLSAYGIAGGSATNPSIAENGPAWARTCQDCHMPRVTGKLCNKNNVPLRTDMAFHDLTGGNTWISRILASVDQANNNPVFDQYNYDILTGKHAGARIDVQGLQKSAPALLDGETRALANLQRAADVLVVAESANAATVRILNNTGHKLISGFPEGRRMWLNIRFVDANGTGLPGTAINEYEELVTTLDAQGNEEFVSGGTLHVNRDDLVYEAKLSSALTGEDKTFHFVLATDRYKDNRIPPKGFRIAEANQRLVQPRQSNLDAPDYFTAAEYRGGYDDVTFQKPAGAAGWIATLYYQTTSRDYVEFLRNEINATGEPSLSSPTLSGFPEAYIVQSDPFFVPFKGWGDAIWDLWLHNGGSAPVSMAATISRPEGRELTSQPDGVHLRFDTIVGRTYQVETSAELTAGSWTAVGSLLTGTGGPAEVVDPDGLGHERRFYRVVSTQTLLP